MRPAGGTGGGMPTTQSLRPHRRTRRALVAALFGVASISGLAACSDDDSGDDPDGLPEPGGVSDENVPLPDDGAEVDTDDDQGGDDGVTDGERPGVGSEGDDMDPGQVDDDGDGVTGDADEGDANTDALDTEEDE